MTGGYSGAGIDGRYFSLLLLKTHCYFTGPISWCLGGSSGFYFHYALLLYSALYGLYCWLEKFVSSTCSKLMKSCSCDFFICSACSHSLFRCVVHTVCCRVFVLLIEFAAHAGPSGLHFVFLLCFGGGGHSLTFVLLPVSGLCALSAHR